MRTITRSLTVGLFAIFMTFAFERDANAQYPVAAQPVAPAVVGYAAQRRGLFGRRVVYRPVVAPVPVAAVPVAPVVTAARPVIAAPVTVGYAPAVAPVTVRYAPVTVQYAPAVVAPVAAYRIAPAPIVAPVRTYRVAVPYVYGF